MARRSKSLIDKQTMATENQKNAKPNPEILSWSAKNGKFDPFEDKAIVEHLGIKDVHQIHILDTGIGGWVTHIRNSPPVVVVANSTVHMKKRENLLDPKSAISLTQVKSRMSQAGSPSVERKPTCAKREWEPETIDLTKSDSPSPKKPRVLSRKEDSQEEPAPTSPTPSPLTRLHNNTNDVNDVGSKPARLSTFPARTVGQMVSRIQWIVAQGDSDETVKSRFSRVFSCRYAKSTYFLHQRAWKWLHDNGVLQEASDSDLWGPLVKAAKVAFKDGEDCDDGIEAIKRKESVEL